MIIYFMAVSFLMFLKNKVNNQIASDLFVQSSRTIKLHLLFPACLVPFHNS